MKEILNASQTSKLDKGIFITFEGIEGSGKSTQINLLKLFLMDKYDCLITREPGGPPISEAIRELLLDTNNSQMVPQTELLLYLASRAQHTAQWILPALKQGKIVVCDRYTDSTLAYQGAARELPSHIISLISSFATQELKPDLTFLLDLDVKEGQNRIQNRKLDRLEAENPKFHQKVRQEYLRLAKLDPKRYIVIDGSLEIKHIHELIKKNILTQIRSV